MNLPARESDGAGSVPELVANRLIENAGTVRSGVGLGGIDVSGLVEGEFDLRGARAGASGGGRRGRSRWRRMA
jgi:hypothetical protein